VFISHREGGGKETKEEGEGKERKRHMHANRLHVRHARVQCHFDGLIIKQVSQLRRKDKYRQAGRWTTLLPHLLPCTKKEERQTGREIRARAKKRTR